MFSIIPGLNRDGDDFYNGGSVHFESVQFLLFLNLMGNIIFILIKQFLFSPKSIFPYLVLNCSFTNLIASGFKSTRITGFAILNRLFNFCKPGFSYHSFIHHIFFENMSQSVISVEGKTINRADEALWGVWNLSEKTHMK